MTVEVPEIHDTSGVHTAAKDIVDRILALELPSQQDYVYTLLHLNVLVAFLLIVCGLVYLLQGWKLFKILVIANAAMIGGFMGAQLGGALRGQDTALFGGIAGALLLAVLAWPLLKYAVSLMGAICGGLLGYGVWNYIAVAIGHRELATYAWAGGLLGMITLALLAFVILKFTVMVFTSFQGALMTASGLLAMLMKYDAIRSGLKDKLAYSDHLVTWLIAVPTILGFALQRIAMSKKSKKSSKGGDGG